LNAVFHELAVAAYRDADDYEGPVKDLLAQLASRMATECEYDLSTTPITDR
jgi:hypothetical protein